MPDPSDSKKRVLFVDDDPEFLELIEKLFSNWAKEDWEIHTATNTGKALSIIQDMAIDLVVIDMMMPVVDGLQFLKLLNRKYPNLAKAALTGSDDEAYRAACLSHGAELFLQKPTSIDGYKTVYANLNEVVKLQAVEGFRGVLRRVGLQEVLQLECLGTKSSILEAANSQTRGRIYIRDGRIIHATLDQLQGVKAFNRIMALQGGDFSLRPFSEPESETINDSWEMLIMEAARVSDEGEDEEPEVAPAAMPWEDTDFVAAPEALENEADAAPDPTPAVITETTEEAKAQAKAALKPQIEEMLICSPQGDVLYEWNCENSEALIEMLEFISQQSKMLRQALPLGKFDRVEIQSDVSRTVAQMQAEHATVIRSTSSPLHSEDMVTSQN